MQVVDRSSAGAYGWLSYGTSARDEIDILPFDFRPLTKCSSGRRQTAPLSFDVRPA